MAPKLEYEQLRVLVIEDQPFIRKMIVEILINIGFRQIKEAEDGAAGLEIVAAWPLDLIICDIEMGPVDGLSFLETLRRDDTPGKARSPVIFVTSHAESETVERARDLGVDAFIVKLPSTAALQSRIDFVLRRQ